MPQPRIDMRVVRAGISVIRQWAPIEDVESLQELADELDDRDDGADILVALTPREAEVVVDTLQKAGVGQYGLLDEQTPGTTALEEISAALRGVVVHHEG